MKRWGDLANLGLTLCHFVVAGEEIPIVFDYKRLSQGFLAPIVARNDMVT